MNAFRPWIALSLILVCALATKALAASPVKSGLQPGEKITHIFEPLNVNGEHAGEPYCLVCENGLAPVAMVFAREVTPAVVDLIVELDLATQHHQAKQLGSFVVFLSDKDDELKLQLEKLVKERKIKRTILAINPPPGPEGFAVAEDADVTAVLYTEHQVKANHAFREGELTGAAIGKIVDDLPKILGK